MTNDTIMTIGKQCWFFSKNATPGADPLAFTFASAIAAHARDETAKEIYEWWYERWRNTDGGMGLKSLEAFRDKFVSPPPQEPAPAKPTLDEATVRSCIDFLKGGSHNGAAIILKSLLPKPAPEPERYVTVREVMDIIAPLCSTTGDIIGIKTQLLERAALRRAAKGGEGK